MTTKYKILKGLAAALCLLTWSATGAFAADSPNLISNPGFESGDAAWKLERGNATVTANTSSSGSGGGIYNRASAVLVLNGTTTVSANTSNASGGGIYNEGTLTINPPATVTGNTPDDCVGC